MDPVSYLEARRALVDEALDHMLPSPDNGPSVLYEAMRYCVFAGGKRLRPILAMAAAEAVGARAQTVTPLAVSLECVHTYSLIHDDLPAMDDDDLRRGMPTAHKVYGEAIAVLAGDALQAFAFQALTSAAVARRYRSDRLIKVIGELACAAGPMRLVAGQAMDILSEGAAGSIEAADYIIANKTGALIRASLVCGGILAGASAIQTEVLGALGQDLGAVFQIKDDLLDLEGTVEDLGKAVGKDQGRGKLTYPRLVGKEEAKRRMIALMESALGKSRELGPRGENIRGLCEYIGNRVS